MKQKDDIKHQVEKTFTVLNDIKKVGVSPFFSHKVLQAINNEKEQKAEPLVISWFTPKLQLASMIIILLVNVSAIFYAFNNSNATQNSSEIESFAVEYNLQSNSNSFLN